MKVKHWLIVGFIWSWAFSAGGHNELHKLVDMAEALSEKGDHAKAASKFRQAERRALELGEDYERLMILNEIAIAEFLAGNFSNAYESKTALIIATPKPSIEDYLNLAIYAIRAGQIENAFGYLDTVEFKSGKTSAQIDPRAHHIKAIAFQSSYKPREAIDSYKKARDQFTKKNDLSNAAEMNLAIANAYKEYLAEFDNALQYYHKASREFRAANDLEGHKRTETDRGNTLLEVGRIKEAIEILRASHSTYEKHNHATVQNLHNMQILANAYFRYGEYDVASDLISTILVSVNDIDTPQDYNRIYLNARNLQAMLLATSGQLQEGLSILGAALRFAEEANMPRKMAHILNNLGYWHRINGDTQQAIQTMQKAVELDEKTGNTAGLTYTYRNLGLAFIASGDLARAEIFLNRAFAMSEYYKIPYNLILSQLGLAQLALARNDPTTANRIYHSLLEREELRFFPLERWQVYSGYSLALANSRDLDGAKQQFQKAFLQLEHLLTALQTTEATNSFKHRHDVLEFYKNYKIFLLTIGDYQGATSLQRRWDSF